MSRNLAFLLAARWPPTLAPDCRHRLLFCLLFFDRFLEGIFSIFVHFWLPLGTPKIIKNRQKSTSEAFLFPSLCLSCFFSCFWLILDDFEDAKCVYFIGRADKICILAKNELWQSWDRFWTHFGCFSGGWGSLKWGKVGSRRGSKKRQFSRSLFFRFWLILGPLEGPKPRPPLPLFRFFSDPGGYFFCSGVIFANFHGFLCFGTYFFMNFHDFLTLFFSNAVAFSEAIFCHESPRFCQKPPRLWSISSHTSAPRVECGGLLLFFSLTRSPPTLGIIKVRKDYGRSLSNMRT